MILGAGAFAGLHCSSKRRSQNKYILHTYFSFQLGVAIMKLSESMKCGALEPLSRTLLCRGGDDNGNDGLVEVQRVVERDGKLHLEVVYEEVSTINAAPAEEQTFDDTCDDTYDDTCADTFDEASNLHDEVETVMLRGRTFTYQHNHGCGQMMCTDDDYEYGTFDEGEETDAAADMLAKDMMLGASRTYTYDDTSIEDQKTNLDDVNDRSAYISGASTYDDESTVFNKRSQKAVNPVQTFIYNVLGVEDPPPVEKQKLSSVLEEHSVGTSTRTGTAAEDVIKSPSSLPSARLRRADKGSIRGMELAFISEAEPESEEMEKEKEEEKEKSVAVDNDDDDGTERTSLNETQDTSADSENGSVGGVEETEVMFEELALESPRENNDDKVTTTRIEEDNNSAKLSVQGGTKENPDEHSDASALLVLTHKIVIDEATTEEPNREDDRGEQADEEEKVDVDVPTDSADAADDKEEKAGVPTKSTDMIVSQEQQQEEQKEQSKASTGAAVSKKSKKAGASGKSSSKLKKIFAKSIRLSKKSVATF